MYHTHDPIHGGIFDLPDGASGKRPKRRDKPVYRPATFLTIEVEGQEEKVRKKVRALTIARAQTPPEELPPEKYKGIPFGLKVGPLLIDDDPSGGRVGVTCDCGRYVLYRPQELMDIANRFMGCCEEGCTVSNKLTRLYAGNRRESVRLQLYALLKVCPVKVAEEWGGNAGVSEGGKPELAVAADRLYTHLLPQQPAPNQIWLQRMELAGDFAPGNVRLSKYPDHYLRSMYAQRLTLDGQRYKVVELCRLTRKPWPALFLLLAEVDDGGEDILFKLQDAARQQEDD